MRTFVALFLGVGAGIFGFAVGLGATGSSAGAVLIGAGTAVGAGVLLFLYPIMAFDEEVCPTALKVMSGLAAVMALLVLARLTVFMTDPSRVSFSFVPTSRWETQHSCVSAYFVAAKSASIVPNVYADSLYTASDDNAAKPRKPRMIGPFNIDVYEYPPPFLLLPRVLQHVAPDFTRFRALWFGLNGFVISLALLVIARALGPSAGTRALLLSPLVWLSLPMVSDLQKGNVQAMVIAVAMIAMALIERRHRAAGGALLAFVSVGKLYPSLLCVYLLARREWRALAWTATFSALFTGLTFLDLGLAPFTAFWHRLPGLLSGEAFPAFRNPAPTATNFSIPGLVFKLKLFGVPGMSFGAMRIVGWFYTLVAGGVTLAAGLRTWRDEERPLVWIAILVLATLRSPFLPQGYAAIPALWLLTLTAATFAASPKALLVTLTVWAALNIYWPADWTVDLRLLAVASGVPQAVTLILALLVIRGTWRQPGAHTLRINA